jgi:glycerophosphoryl diester phosphodiesterase
MRGPAWLTERPIAHRGLHDASRGIIENTPSAFEAAIDHRYGIECDLQITADGEAMVHHDATLGRLNEGDGALAAMAAADLKRIRFKATADPMITLTELCELVAGRVPLFLELKSLHDDDDRLPRRVAEVLKRYDGPVAAMSFDPYQMQRLRAADRSIVRGLTAERRSSKTEAKRASAYLSHLVAAWPDFLAYNVDHLPSLPSLLTRFVIGRPVLAWTVRTPEQRMRASWHAHQIIFEGFRPEPPHAV